MLLFFTNTYFGIKAQYFINFLIDQNKLFSLLDIQTKKCAKFKCNSPSPLFIWTICSQKITVTSQLSIYDECAVVHAKASHHLARRIHHNPLWRASQTHAGSLRWNYQRGGNPPGVWLESSCSAQHNQDKAAKTKGARDADAAASQALRCNYFYSARNQNTHTRARVNQNVKLSPFAVNHPFVCLNARRLGPGGWLIKSQPERRGESASVYHMYMRSSDMLFLLI